MPFPVGRCGILTLNQKTNNQCWVRFLGKLLFFFWQSIQINAWKIYFHQLILIVRQLIWATNHLGLQWSFQRAQHSSFTCFLHFASSAESNLRLCFSVFFPHILWHRRKFFGRHPFFNVLGFQGVNFQTIQLEEILEFIFVEKVSKEIAFKVFLPRQRKKCVVLITKVVIFQY